MCTAASYKTKDFYFGRTLDYEFSYGDEIVVLPREYPLRFRHCGALDRHYAIIGMAYVAGSDPLFYDGINEKGLGMAGLNFVGNAHYFKPVQGFDNVAQFEFIPWILSRLRHSARGARAALAHQPDGRGVQPPASARAAALDNCRPRRGHNGGVHERRAENL